MITKKRRFGVRYSLSLITFLISLILSHSIGEIFYNSIDGTDFYRYFRYIEYFMGEIETPTREQGLFYFWVISLFIKIKKSSLGKNIFSSFCFKLLSSIIWWKINNET